MKVVIFNMLCMLLEGIGLTLIFYKTIPFFIGIYDKNKTKIYKNLEWIVIGVIMFIAGYIYLL